MYISLQSLEISSALWSINNMRDLTGLNEMTSFNFQIVDVKNAMLVITLPPVTQ